MARTRKEVHEDYEGFVEKFKHKKTTDDCYTPPEIYDAIRDWACAEYGIDPDKIVRPFYPGGDYKNYEYQEGAVVLDNPPFSIFAEIIDFYTENSIPFFLFAPGLTLLSTAGKRKVNCIFTDVKVVYENGACVNTEFVTSYGDYAVRTSPELRKRILEAQKKAIAKIQTQKATYSYPQEILTGSFLKRIVTKGVDFKVKRGDLHFIRQLDSQKAIRKGIYGGGFLLSEKAAAEKNETIVLELSDRERQIIDGLGV